MSEPCKHILTSRPSLKNVMFDKVACPACGKKLAMRPDVLMAAYTITYGSGYALSRAIFPFHSWQIYIVATAAVLFFWIGLHWLLMRILPFQHVDPVESAATRYRVFGGLLLCLALLILIVGLYSRYSG